MTTAGSGPTEGPAGSAAGVGDTSPAPAVRLSAITKRYGSVVACNGVDIDLAPGRVHGILGENGAGKSTLMKILIGLIQPDEGTIAIDGDIVTIADPLAAADLGIAMVHQHYSLVEPMTVWENVLLGERARLDRVAACELVATISDRYGLGVDPLARVADLTAGQRQRVEIIKCLRREPRIIIFDEPTSMLTPAESEQLFSVLRTAVVDGGRTVALVSHKLDEILHATDEVTIMRGGRVVDRSATSSATASSLAQAMVGRPVSLRSEAAALGLIDAAAAAAAFDLDDGPALEDHAPVVLEIRGATVLGSDGHKMLDDLSITVRAGEIVGLAGVEGNGQRQLGDVLSGLVHLDRGMILVSGKEIDTAKPGDLTDARVGVIPEDRHDSGCVLDMTVAENLAFGALTGLSRNGVIDRKAMEVRAEELMKAFDIQARSPNAPMGSLSGGNQQRVVLARELSADPVVLVAAQPTRGLDVGAIEYMSERIRAAAIDGVGVLLISTEIEEVLTLAHRICVIHEGRIIGEMAHHEADLERLGLMLGGVSA